MYLVDKVWVCREASVTSLTRFWRHATRQCAAQNGKLAALKILGAGISPKLSRELELAGAAGLLWGEEGLS